MSFLSPNADLSQATARWYVKCADCLSVSAYEAPVTRNGHPDNPPTVCGACEGKLIQMGRVVGSQDRLKTITNEVPHGCDASCVYARGPQCDCPCGGINHGTKMLVVVVRDGVKVPTITPTDPDAARAVANEFRDAVGAVQDRVDAAYGAVLEAKAAGRWIPNFNEYLEAKRALTAIDDASHLKVHKTRMARLAAIAANVAPVTVQAATPPPPPPVRLATPKQVDFLRRLVSERDVTEDIRVRATAPDLAANDASSLITTLLLAPVRRDATLEPGMYRRDGIIYKVQRARQSGNLYAKVLVPIHGARLSEDGNVVHWQFEYAPGAMKTLRAADRLSLEEARAFGIQHGFCCVCAKRLDDADSVAAGIGPVCAKRMGSFSTAKED